MGLISISKGKVERSRKINPNFQYSDVVMGVKGVPLLESMLADAKENNLFLSSSCKWTK
jgi:hypothetical protein